MPDAEFDTRPGTWHQNAKYPPLVFAKGSCYIEDISFLEIAYLYIILLTKIFMTVHKEILHNHNSDLR